MDSKITLILHHGGKFLRNDRDGNIEYVGGEFDVWEDMFADYMNLFVLSGLAASCKNYHKVGDIYWLVEKGVYFEEGFCSCKTDADICELVNHAVNNGNEVHVYFDHKVDDFPMDLEWNGEPILEEEEEDDDVVILEKFPNEVPTATEGDSEGDDDPDSQSEDDTGSDDDWLKDFPLPSNSTELEVNYESDTYHSEELQNPQSSDDEPDFVHEVFPQYKEDSDFGNVKLEIGMEFNNLDTFKAAVRDYTIHLGRQIRWKKNDAVRARTACYEKECKWEIYCGQNKPRRSFQIKSFQPKHTCCRGFKNKQANRGWIVLKLDDKLRSQPSLRCSEAMEYFKKKFGIQVEQSMMWRAMKEAREVVEGSERKQYAKLYDYAHQLLQSNPGSTVKINTIPSPEGPPQFQRLYICLDGCKRGFVGGCRPFIGLDGCFLKSAFGGNLLSAVGLDGNNHIFVIACAVVDVENKDNWKWFLSLLHEDLGDYVQHGWNFMSDMQKGLIPALQEVMPGAPHRFCVMHLWKNFIKQWKSKELRGVVWNAAKSTTVSEFDGHMEHVKRLNKQAWDYLNKWPKEAWTKAHFSTVSKVDNICNNTCEVFNAKIVQYRTKPIITMLEEIRCYIMRTMTAHKLKLVGKDGPLCPVQSSRLEKEIKFANHWTPQWAGDADGVRYEVSMWGKRVQVNILEHSCTCRMWQLTGMPCRHAIACIQHMGGKPELMCNDWLSICAYNKTYEYFIQPVEGPEYWTHTDYVEPLPPPKKVQRGRPKKNRRRDGEEELLHGTRVKRKLADFTCSRCGGKKHTVKTCKVPPPPPPEEDEDLLAQDDAALVEEEEAANAAYPPPEDHEVPVEINLSQPDCSQATQDDPCLGPAAEVDVPGPISMDVPVPRYKLTIRRATCSMPTQLPPS